MDGDQGAGCGVIEGNREEGEPVGEGEKKVAKERLALSLCPGVFQMMQGRAGGSTLVVHTFFSGSHCFPFMDRAVSAQGLTLGCWRGCTGTCPIP